MESKKHFDFLASFALLALSAYVVIAGYGIYRDAGEILYVSPGFFPIVLGIVLGLCSVLLLASSLKDGGLAGRRAEVSAWWNGMVRSKDTATTLVGIAIMFIYTYVLMRYLPFWLASLIFMVVLMLFLRSTSKWKILLISAGTVAAIVVFFQVGFGVPLP